MRKVLTLLMTLLALASARPGFAAPPELPGRIAFVRGGKLWLWEGGQERQVTAEGEVRDPRFSADGRYLAYNQAGALWVMGLNGAAWKVAKSVEPARWSPAAPALAVQRPEGVGVVEIGERGPSPLRLIAKGWSEPAWSQDGRVLAVVQNRSGKGFTGDSTIGLTSPQGGEVRVIWQEPYQEKAWVGPATALKWSADGRWLAFYRVALSASLAADSNQLTVVSAAGGKATALTSGPVNRTYYAWAPQGATLAFTAGVGRMAWQEKRVNLAPMPPKPPYKPLTPPGYADREPVWGPGGRLLYFIRSEVKVPPKMYMPGPRQAIWRYDLKSGALEQVPETEEALGVRSGSGGRLLWPRLKQDEERASLWTALGKRGVPLVDHVDMAGSYYGQFDWDRVYDWWSPEE